MAETNVKQPLNTTQQQEPATSPEQHHHIGRNENTYEDISNFLQRHANDPAIEVCGHLKLDGVF